MHLGSGASMCAIQHGKSLDTTMGLTPVSGLPGATRSGAIDPSLIFHYTNRAGRISHDRSVAVDVHVTQAEEILNKRSGWAALTGTTDFGAIVREMKAVEARRARGEEVREEEGKWKVAFDLFLDRIVGYLGAYYVKLEGEVDALVFAGGIGERSVELREAVVEKVKCLGFALDEGANREVDGKEGAVVDVGKLKDMRRVLVCRTDEQVSFGQQWRSPSVNVVLTENATARDGEGMRDGPEVLAAGLTGSRRARSLLWAAVRPCTMRRSRVEYTLYSATLPMACIVYDA